MTYHFALIRFVPDSARGEFVNIGAIAGDDDAGDWAVRWISNFARAKALDSPGYLPTAKAFTALLDERFGEELDELSGDVPTADWLGSLAVEMNNVVQITDLAPVVADSAEAALDLVFDRLVVDPARTRFRFQKKNVAQAATRRAYRAHKIAAAAIIIRPRVVSGPWDFQFDFGVHNGRAVQLAQCWSFELPNQSELREQVKAWAWMVHEVRRSGGELVGDESFGVPSDLDVAAIYVPPRGGTDSPAFKEARSAFNELDVTAAPFDGADLVGESAAQRLSSSAIT